MTNKTVTTGQSTELSGIAKINQLRRLIKKVESQLELYDQVEWEKRWNYPSVLKDQIKERRKFSKVIVPENSGYKFAEKYDMLPGGAVGKYIDKLNNYENLFDDRQIANNNMIMLIVAAGVFYGEYEYLKYLATRTTFSNAEKVALDMMGEDVRWTQENIVPALKKLDKKSSEKEFEETRFAFYNEIYHKFISYSFGHCDTDGERWSTKREVLEDLCRNEEECKKNAEKIRAEKHDLMMLIDKKAGYQLYHLYDLLWESFCTVGADWVILGGSGADRILEILVGLRKKATAKYVIARSNNLWGNAVLRLQDSYIEEDRSDVNKSAKRYARVLKKTAQMYDDLNLTREKITSLNKGNRK